MICSNCGKEMYKTNDNKEWLCPNCQINIPVKLHENSCEELR